MHSVADGSIRAAGKYPAVERDFSFVFADDVEFEAMRRAVMGLGIG
jgi:phenylalanyl-tRNA synthetase beta subunit